jgi:outer membrane protein OmpA-like peptidoglycan-associated protein
MIKRSLLIIMTGIMLGGPLTGRELANGLSQKATLKLADRYYAESSFYSAANNYKLYLHSKPNDRYATYWLAMALYRARDYQGSEATFAAYYALKPSKKTSQKAWNKQETEFFKEGHLYYGMVLHRNGKYDQAKQELSKFKHAYYSNNKGQQWKMLRLADLEMTSCDSAKTLHTQPVKVTPLPEGINNAYGQSASFLYDPNTLYYSSVNENKLVRYTDTKNKEYNHEYTATGSGKTWSNGTQLPAIVTQDTRFSEEKYFVGNGTFNLDRTRFYFTKCKEMDDDRSLCNIFVADVKNGKISPDARRLPEGINYTLKYTSTQPTVRTLTDKREIVYYATDRDGGKGGMDIWYTTRTKEGEYTAPKPLSNVNTKADELTPFFDDSTKTLYFSSDGLPGMGGFDVFAITLKDDGNSWNDPYNMGKALNTGADELYYTVNKNTDQANGFLVSNREGSIPLAGIATASDDIFYWEDLPFGLNVKIIRKGVPAANMDGAHFKLYQVLPDGSRKLVATTDNPQGSTGFFNLRPGRDYEVEGAKDGYLPHSNPLTTKGLDKEDTLTSIIELSRDSYIVYGKVIGYDSTYYYGLQNSTMTIAELKDGKEVLYKEISVADSSYSVSIPAEQNYRLRASKEAYFAGDQSVSTKNVPDGADSIRADIQLLKVERSKTYRLANILYDFDMYTLTRASTRELDTLYKLLKVNPTFSIELSSHTDGMGTDAYNMTLSQARAQSCVNYLINKGISRNRMIAKGYGMRNPIAPNKNADGTDNPDGRALNRRTEFRIIK